jgi:hypothetical protein
MAKAKHRRPPPAQRKLPPAARRIPKPPAGERDLRADSVKFGRLVKRHLLGG